MSSNVVLLFSSCLYSGIILTLSSYLVGKSASTVFKINASNDEIVDKVCEQFKMYQLDHIPESFYTEKEKAKEGELFRDFQRCLCIPF